MTEITGADIWDFHARGLRICITTNGDINRYGRAVMGRGVAKQAALKFPNLPLELSRQLRTGGNNVHLFPHYNLCTFPVKRHWKDMADLKLIEQSCIQLSSRCGWFGWHEAKTVIVIPRPGCGNGGLDWSQVKPILEKHFVSNSFWVVTR